LLSSGSEVQLIIEAQSRLADIGIAARIVSMPSMELFEQQSCEYQALVLPPGVPRVAIEAAARMSWYKWVDSQGEVIGIDRFGASAPYEKIYEGFGITAAHVVDAAQRMIMTSPTGARA
jgi:transketolase